MNRSNAMRRLLPHRVYQGYSLRMEKRALAALRRATLDVRNLTTSASLVDAPDWPEVQTRVALDGERAGMVNPGDRRAIYALSKGRRSVLEVGTHVGGSTVMLALATERVTTVDISDVNGPQGAYRRLGCESPRNLLNRVGVSNVSFYTSSSVDWLRNCRDRFDFIFLDGSHDADVVYQEVPLAVRLLNPNGVILLHDVCPNLQPLWAEEDVIPGPWLAYERFRSEGAPIRVQPLGALPWPTKYGGNITSLALLLRA